MKRNMEVSTEPNTKVEPDSRKPVNESASYSTNESKKITGVQGGQVYEKSISQKITINGGYKEDSLSHRLFKTRQIESFNSSPIRNESPHTKSDSSSRPHGSKGARKPTDYFHRRLVELGLEKKGSNPQVNRRVMVGSPGCLEQFFALQAKEAAERKLRKNIVGFTGPIFADLPKERVIENGKFDTNNAMAETVKADAGNVSGKSGDEKVGKTGTKVDQEVKTGEMQINSHSLKKTHLNTIILKIKELEVNSFRGSLLTKTLQSKGLKATDIKEALEFLVTKKALEVTQTSYSGSGARCKPTYTILWGNSKYFHQNKENRIHDTSPKQGVE